MHKTSSFNARSKSFEIDMDDTSSKRESSFKSIIVLEECPVNNRKRKSLFVDSTMPELLQSKELIKIDLKDCRLTSVDFLLKFVSMHSNVAKVDLQGNDLSDDQIEKLLEMLKANIVIT